jgi:hypothetical protein
MSIKNLIKKLEKQVRVQNSGYCQCFELTINDYPKKISSVWLEIDVCAECGKAVNQQRVKEIFDLERLGDSRVAETEKLYNSRK